MSDLDQDNRFFKVIMSSIADGVFTVASIEESGTIPPRKTDLTEETIIRQTLNVHHAMSNIVDKCLDYEIELLDPAI